MKILVCGSMRLRNAEKLIKLLDELHEQSAITCLVNGGARGADLPKEAFCALNDRMLKEEPPDLVLAVDPGPISDDSSRRSTVESPKARQLARGPKDKHDQLNF